MAATEKENYPMLVWKSGIGCWQGVLCEEWEFQWAVGRSEREVTTQFKGYLDWHLAEYGWTPECSIDRARMRILSVDVRPEYTSMDNRVSPCPETVRLRFPVVYGEIGGNMFGAAIPLIDTFFTYHQEGDLERLARHYVVQNLKGKSPDELVRYEQVVDPELKVLPFRKTVSRKSKLGEWFEKPEYNNLKEIAEPMPTRVRGRKKAAPAFEREPEVHSVVERLMEGPVNLCVVGEQGCGKSTVLLEAIKRITRNIEEMAGNEGEDRPSAFWRTNAQRLIAGAPYLGQWEARLESVINELQDASAWLVCDSLSDLVQTGGKEAGDGVAKFMLPYLSRGELKLILEATPEELETCRRLIPDFLDVFQIVRIQPMVQERARALMDRVIQMQERIWKVDSEKGVGESVIRLHGRFFPYQSFPGSSVRFVERVFERAANEKSVTVSLERILTAFVKETGLQEWLLKDDVPLVFEDVVTAFEKKIIGQREACLRAAEVVTRLKAGMNDPKRPISVLLFCGPTGVGKTALARWVADYLFGAGDASNRLLRLDMSEYGFPGSVGKLTMDLRGHPSKFISQIRAQPFQVVLLDEIEKAAPEVFDLFLNVFDEGRLSDPAGRFTSFRNTIIVMTSNIGVKQGTAIGFTGEDQIDYEGEVMKFFRPEFFNRIDRIVPFNAFDEIVVRKIAELELGYLGDREGLSARRLKLRWTPEVVDFLSRNGFDSRLGARPLQRCIEENVVTALSRFLLRNKPAPGAEIRLFMSEAGRVEVALGETQGSGRNSGK